MKTISQIEDELREKGMRLMSIKGESVDYLVEMNRINANLSLLQEIKQIYEEREKKLISYNQAQANKIKEMEKNYISKDEVRKKILSKVKTDRDPDGYSTQDIQEDGKQILLRQLISELNLNSEEKQ
jgi:translation initiation factor 2B subunit (eIF-2B alpha/beta/delta family)